MTERQVDAMRRRITIAGNVVNTAGAAITAVYFLLVLPGPDARLLTPPVGLSLAAVYSLVAALTANRAGLRYATPIWAWLSTGRRPTDEERRQALGYPAELARISIRRWALGAVLFGALGLFESASIAAELLVGLLLAGATVATATALVGERLLRPVIALALDAQAPPEGSLSVGRRLFLAWVLCSAVPVVMIALIPVGREFESADDLVAPTLFLAGWALLSGLLATKLTTARVAGALRRLRAAADAVGAGDLAVRVDVDDASEVGRLQAGFNQMVAGLRERERLRDLIERSVGRDVAAEALEHGAALGGHVRTVSALFVDVVGSSRLASREHPEQVVELLNRFFATVVGVVERHGGFVNKFEGDGALCVFGAPVEQPGHAASCLAAARELAERLQAEDLPRAAIGISCGEAVAGWVGAESRFEYTVIGDPVNEAARLCERAKPEPGLVLASAATVEVAGLPEAGRWAPGEELELRGRDRPTRVARPRRLAQEDAPAAARAAGGG